MRILQVKVKGIISEEQKQSIENDIKRSILDGFITHDETIELHVLEFDEIEVKD